MSRTVVRFAIVAVSLVAQTPLVGQISRTLLDGQTPPAIDAGAAQGAWALSSLESVNLFSGSVGFTAPLLSIGGRGSVQFDFLLPISRRWTVRAVQYDSASAPSLFPNNEGSKFLNLGYGMPLLERRNDAMEAWCNESPYIASTLTRLHWIEADGNDTELVDVGTMGTPQSYSTCGGGVVTPFNREKTFVSTNGTSMTFVADADVVDEQSTGGSYPAGTLYKKDGTRYRMSEGKLQWMSDRNGNLINFESTDPTRPGVTDPWGRPLAVYDALGRKIQIDYGGTGNHPGEDRITYPGYSATASEVTHTAYIRFDSLANRLIAGESLQKVEDLFPGSKIVGYANQNQDYNNPVLVSEVELADGRKFSFRYNRYAELAEVRLHTGGYVRYEWAGYTAAGDGLYGNLLIYRRLKTRKVYDSDGATLLSQSEYVCPNLEQQSSVQVLVTAIEKDSAGMELRRTEHTFHGGPISAASVAPMSFPGWREGREYNTKVKEAGGTVLQEVQQGWQQRGPANTSITPSTEIAPPNDPRITQTTTTLGALSAVRTYVYSVDEHNNLAQQCEKDYGAGTPTRCTDWTYATSTSYTDTPAHLRALPLSQAVTRYLPGPTTVESSLTYEYDTQAGGLTNYTGIVQHDPARGTGYLTRGNVTKESRDWAESPDGAAAETAAEYDIAGNRVKVTTPKVESETGRVAGVTTLAYADQYADATGKGTYAFASTVTNAEGQVQQRWYSWGAGGRLTKARDANGQETTYDYNDALDRLKTVTPPIGVTNYQYLDTTRQVVTQQRLKPDGTYVTTTVDYDALGRTVQQSVSGGPKKAWQYDALGRVWKESNPSYGSFVWTEFLYDALERVTQVVYPDGSAEKRCYTNNATLAVDAAGKFTKVTKDGLGRVSSVMEDANGSCLGSTNAAGQNLATNYTYTGSDQLWTVNQGGQTRTFEYDSLGRLKNASNPESGAVAYTLDAAGNVVGKAACGRTAAMKYDRLNRILRKTYQDAPVNTPEVAYCYDGSQSRTGCSTAPTGTNLIGRLTQVGNTTATKRFASFDAGGRVLGHTVQIGANSYGFTYEYNDLALKAEVYPSGRRLDYGFDAVGRVNGVTGQKTGESNKTYATGVSYAAHGAQDGGTFGPLAFTASYNERMQATEQKWMAGATTVFKEAPAYAAANNGNVHDVTVTRGAQSWVTTYGYDGLNRLASAVETNGWSRTWDYDRWGNGWVATSPELGRDPFTPAGASNYLESGQTVSDNRLRIQGSDYNSCGELMGIGGHTYTYTAEGQVASITLNGGTVSYGYDGDGQRVLKQTSSGSTTYVHDAGGELVAEYGGTSGGGGTSYVASDVLGSTRALVGADGTPTKCYDYLPFGEEVSWTVNGRGGCFQGTDWMELKFTGKPRDHFGDGTATGLDYFGARYMSSAQGRFTSPDPLDWLSWQNGDDDDKERFQAFISDPQGMNKYSYARNNPLKYVDPTGEDFELAVTFNGDATDEEKARILGAIRQYLTNLKIGNVVVRDAAVKSDDKRTWGQTFKDFFNKDYQTLKIDFTSTYFKDQTFLINAGDMAGKGDFADLRKGDPTQWSNIIAWRSLHEKIAHDLQIGSDMDQGGGLANYQLGTLVGGAYGRGKAGIPALHPTDVRRLQDKLVPRIRSYGR